MNRKVSPSAPKDRLAAGYMIFVYIVNRLTELFIKTRPYHIVYIDVLYKATEIV